MISHLLFQDSPKISQHSKEPKPKGNLTYHQYMPPEPRQGSRADPQAEGSALGLPGPSLWEGTQQPPHRYDSHFCSLVSSGSQHLPPSNPESRTRGVQPPASSSPKTKGSRSPARRPSVPRSPGFRPKRRRPHFLAGAQELASCVCCLGNPDPAPLS